MTSGPRIGVYVVEFPTPSETFIVTKVLGLLDAGFDVHVFATKPSRYWDRFDVLSRRADIRTRVHVSPQGTSRWRLAANTLAAFAGQAISRPRALAEYVVHNVRHRKDNGLGLLKGLILRAHFVGERLDILHIEFDMQATGIIDMKDYLGCRVLLSSRGTIQRTEVLDNYPDAYHYAFSKVDAYHFISEYLRRNTYKLGLEQGLVPEWLIEPAIDVSLFTPPPPRRRTSSDPFRIVSVSRLSWEKGYEFAIDAVARVHAAGVPVEYTIVGEGPYREAIIYAARQHGLLDNGVVKLVGAVNREAVVEHYRNSHVMLHAALEEGFCNAVLEGQAMELPIVTSDTGGLPENVADGISGFVVRQRDADAMAEKLLALANDEELRLRMGRAGRERVRSRFDLADQVEKFATLYRDLAARPPRRSDAT